MIIAHENRTVCLLGPQRHEPNLGEVVARLGLSGSFAVVSAGWEEREREVDELAEHLAPLGRVVPLELSRRTEQLLTRDTELRDLLAARNDKLRRAGERYRLRLRHALAANRELLAMSIDGDPAPDVDIENAIEEVRELDAYHLERIRAIRAEWHDRIGLAERPAVRREREAVAKLVEGCSALLVAGGHVGVLRQRMGMLEPHVGLGARPLLAWSAGAMVVTERIVLFHDSPQQGAGDPEVYEKGFGLVSGVISLPHASKRLQLEDATRVKLFARRFAPDVCLALDRGDFAVIRATTGKGTSVEFGPRTRALGVDGQLRAARREGAVA